MERTFTSAFVSLPPVNIISRGNTENQELVDALCKSSVTQEKRDKEGERTEIEKERDILVTEGRNSWKDSSE